jgi:hypothetical protein
MNGLFNFLHNYNFVRVVTFGAFVSAVLLTVLAGSDIKNIGIDQPYQMADTIRQKLADPPRLREMLIERGMHKDTVASMNDDQIYDKAVNYSKKTSVPHLARLVSGFSSCIFLLMFWFLFQKKRKSQDENKQNELDDYSMLFFGLAMLTWSLPTKEVFRIYGFESLARALNDSRAFLNSIFFICAYWDMEYKIPERWKSFFSFPIPIWSKRFVEKYSKRGTFVLLTGLLTTVILILFFAGIAHTKIDGNDISWYDFFDFFFSVGFSLLFIVAIIFGFHKRIRYSENDNSLGIGSIMGLFIASGFVVVLLFYAVDNPLGWRPPQSLKDLVDTGIFQLVYQFLILFSVSFLAFSGAYEKEMKKANDLKSINIKLKEEQKKIQNANVGLENQKSELEKNKDALQSLNIKLEEEQKKLQDANVDLETSIEQEKQARIREKEQIDKLAEVKKQEEEKLIYHRRQITHLTRGALLNQVLEFQSIKDLSTDSLKTPYEEIVMRLNSTLEFLRYIDKNSSDDPKRINIQRYLNNSIEKYSKSVPNITIDYSNIDLESYKEINTENAVRIVCSLLELTTNAVKSINKTLCSNPLVVINAINTGTSLEISVIDNGEGGYFSKEYQGESGFGTQYLNLLVKKHFNGDWVVTPNSPLSGSVAKIIISNNKIL